MYVWLPLLLLLCAGAALYWVHPLAPLFLLLSVLIQLPIILLITRASFTSSYNDRVWARKEQYEKDGDAAAWLAQEQAEAKGVGFRYWSSKGRMRNMLLRAKLLTELGQKDQAALLLAEIIPGKLSAEDQAGYAGLVASGETGENG